MQQLGPIFVGLFASASIVIGAQLALRPSSNRNNVSLTRVFAFGTGAFVCAVCLDFLPDAWEGNGDRTPLWIFLGAIVMWCATHLSDGLFQREQDKSVAGPAYGESSTSGSFGAESSEDTVLQFTPVSAIVLAAALSFHTFLEGTAVSLAFHDRSLTTLGFSVAVILHKLPEGVLWGLALASVFPGEVTRIKRILLIPAVSTLIGVFLGIFLANQASSALINVSTGIVAGAMLYIAFSELLPALRESTRPNATRGWFVIGLVVMFLLNSLSNVFGG